MSNKYTLMKVYKVEIGFFILMIVSIVAAGIAIHHMKLRDIANTSVYGTQDIQVIKEAIPQVEETVEVDPLVREIRNSENVSMRLHSNEVEYLTESDACMTFTSWSDDKGYRMYGALTVFEDIPEDSIYKVVSNSLKNGESKADVITIDTGYEDVFCYRDYTATLGRQTVLLIGNKVVVVDYWSDPDNKNDDGCELLQQVSVTIDGKEYNLAATF